MMKRKGPLKEPLEVDLTFARRAMTAAERNASFGTGRERSAVRPAAIAGLLERVARKRSVFKGGASDRQPPEKPGLIREPDGVDLVIGGGARLAEEERRAIRAVRRGYAEPKADATLANEPPAAYKPKRPAGHTRAKKK